MNNLARFDACCEDPEHSFADLITLSIKYFGVEVRDLANALEVADYTVERWASGSSRPHPRMQCLVTGHVRRLLAEAAPPTVQGV